MQFHDLKRKHPHQRSKRVGRGGKRGTTSGRGTKGQKARAGRKIRPALRDVIKKIPKKRGYRFAGLPKVKLALVNLGRLERNFPGGSVINPAVLLEKKLIKRVAKVLPKVKILAGGKLSKRFEIKNCLISVTARKRVEAAGGKVV